MDSWIDAALQVLAEQGIEGVKVERLANELGVTKGSFYWHFKDREALLVGMVNLLRRRASIEAAEFLGQDLPPYEILKQLLATPFAMQKQTINLGLSLRLWARQDARVRTLLKEIDQLRIEHMTGLIAACGIPKAEAQAHSILIYSYMRTASALLKSTDKKQRELCENLLLWRIRSTQAK